MSDVPGTAVAVWHPATHPIGELALDTAAEWPWHAQALRDARRARMSARAFAVVVAARVAGRLHLESRLMFASDRAPCALVLGSHPACDVTNLPGTCLRHAVVVGWADGRIDVIDLRTAVGIGIDSERSTRAVATGALRFSAGDADVFVVDAAPTTDLRLSWGELDRRVNAGRPSWSQSKLRAQRSAAAMRELRSLTAERYALTVALREQPRAVHAAQQPRRIVVSSTVDELERGVVIGRYDRCDVQGPLADDVLVSRVHAVIVLRDGKLYAVDAASTNGTQVHAATGEERVDLFGALRAEQLLPGDTVEVCRHRVEIVI